MPRMTHKNFPLMMLIIAFWMKYNFCFSGNTFTTLAATSSASTLASVTRRWPMAPAIESPKFSTPTSRTTPTVGRRHASTRRSSTTTSRSSSKLETPMTLRSFTTTLTVVSPLSRVKRIQGPIALKLLWPN